MQFPREQRLGTEIEMIRDAPRVLQSPLGTRSEWGHQLPDMQPYQGRNDSGKPQ